MPTARLTRSRSRGEALGEERSRTGAGAHLVGPVKSHLAPPAKLRAQLAESWSSEARPVGLECFQF